MHIRCATPHDAELLATLGRQAFIEAFADHPKNHPDDLAAYMLSAFDIDTLARELADIDVTFFVADVDGTAVGYAKLKRDVREVGVVGERPIELCRLYNLRAFIGRGIGSALLRACLDFAQAHGHDVIWLGVWEYNMRAQEFYARFGFAFCGAHVFMLGTDAQTDLLMQRRIIGQR